MKKIGSLFPKTPKEMVSERSGFDWVGTITRDLRHSIRGLRKQPLSNGIIVLTIALVISAVSVFYTFTKNDQNDFLPFSERERIVQFWRMGESKKALLFPGDIVSEYRDRLGAYEAFGAVKRAGPMTLTGVGEPTELNAVGFTLDVFSVIGIGPIRGRLFQEEDETTGDEKRILISEQLWREQLNEDPAIVGSDLLLNDELFTVIGVLPAAMRRTNIGWDVDIWRLMRVDRAEKDFRWLLVAKLKRGISVSQAQAELDVLAPRLEQQHTPLKREKEWYPKGFKTGWVVPITKPFITVDLEIPAEIVFSWVFSGIIFVCVVGIACFNVTNLLLARYSARSREIAIRLSLGARRFRIVQQLLTETIVLALLGGMFGLLTSFWFSHLLRFQHIDPKLDWRLYAMAFSGALLLGLIVGLVPALRSSRGDLTESLKEGGLAIGGRTRHRFRNFLVVSELVMASVLCLAAGLMTRGFIEFYRGDLGFEPERLISVKVQPRGDLGWSVNDQIAYVERGLQALREVPGVASASVCIAHFMPRFVPKEDIRLASVSGEFDTNFQVPLFRVSPGFTDQLGMPVVRGRRLSESWSEGAGEVLVNETFAARYFPGGDAVGRQMRCGTDLQQLTIVGVVRDRNQRMTFTRVGPEVYRDFRNSFVPFGFVFFAETRDRSQAMAGRIREAIARLDARQPVTRPDTITGLLQRRAADVKEPMIGVGLLAGVGLVIALAGVYGVVSFSVVERTREIGVRMAMGASRSRVLWLMLWQGARLILLGVPLGIAAGAFVVSNDQAPAMFGNVSTLDLPTFLFVVLLVGMIGLCASLFPAHRATKIHPMEALRYE